MINISNVHKSYGKVKAISEISLTLERNKIIGLVGNNGSGKTTLMKILSGMINLDYGEVFINGERLNYKHNLLIANLIEEPCFYPGLTGKENLCYFLKINDRENLNLSKYVDLFNMNEHINNKYRTYSQGMKQRLRLIYILSRDTEYLLLDEPLIGLDHLAIQILKKELVKQVNEKNKTVFVVSHNIKDLESICDEIIFIKEGKLVNKINMKDIKKRNRYEISFFNENDVEYAKQILVEELFSINKNKVIIELDDETMISSIIKSLVDLSIKEVKVVQDSLTTLYLRYLGDNTNDK